LFEELLPRHLDIVYEINRRFLDEIKKKYPKDNERLSRMSVIAEGDNKKIRMASLGIIGSFSVNGVSNLHTELLKANMFKDFYELWPEKFNNKTNGITPRRWLYKANKGLSELISKKIGKSWIRNLDDIGKLMDHKDDASFKKEWKEIKLSNKRELAEYIKKHNNVIVDPDSIFDVQIKRIHEYKRQVMFGLYILQEYLKIKNDPKKFVYPRTCILGGKAAPAYHMAKLSIKFINSIADIINNDKSIDGKLKLIFLENYRVSLAEKIFPASELSEQISTAGTEASGTGNMKFMINGALTIGTYDGANIEMTEQVGEENIFIFGLRAHEVQALKKKGYKPADYIKKSPYLKEIHSLMQRHYLDPYEKGIFKPLFDSIFHVDPYLICADFDSYCAMQEKVSLEYRDNNDLWTSKSIINVAKSGFFSSDRTINDYNRDIWKIKV